MESRHPGCDWVGLADDRRTVIVCARAAEAVIADLEGGLSYACPDHLSELKRARGALAGSGPGPFATATVGV